MDKLKPVLAQIFWIVFGIALLLPLIGWFLGTGTMASTIDARIGTINGLNPQDGAAVPNDQWIEKVQVVEKDREQRLETAADFLWNQQQQYMTWPASLAEVKDKTFEDDISIRALNAYRRSFDSQIEALRQIVEPYEYQERTQKMEGKVLLQEGILPLMYQDQAWPTGPPTSKEVWYLQEDLWLLRGLLEAVKDVNDRAGPEANILKVPIKQILSVELMGGNPEALAALASGEVGAEGAAAHGGPGGMPMSGMGMGMGMSGMGMGGEGVGGAAGLDFDIAEEVGPATAMAAEGELSEDGMASHGGGGMPGMPGMPGGESSLLSEKRYVDDVGLPYKTRAFKMQVIMDHRQLPEFLVELTKSPFPVCVLRVHFAEMNQDPLFAGTAGGGYSGGGYDPEGMGGGRGGFGGGMGSSRGGSFGAGRSSTPFGGMPRPGAARSGGSSGRGGMGLMGGMSTRGGASAFGGARGGISSRGGMSPLGMSGNRGGGIGIGASRSGMGFRGGMSTGMESDMYGGIGAGNQTGLTDLSAQALADPYLSQVVIAGLMTIYRSEQEIANAAEGEAATEEPATGEAAAAGVEGAVEGEAPAEGEMPVEGEAPLDGTEPLDGTAPLDGALPPEGEAPTDDATAPADGVATEAADAAEPAADVSAEPSPDAADDPAATAPAPEGEDPGAVPQ